MIDDTVRIFNRTCGCCRKEIKENDRVYQVECDDESFVYIHEDCMNKKRVYTVRY